MKALDSFQKRQLAEAKACFPIGSAVKHSTADIERKRQYWLQQGRQPAKSNAERWWKEFAAERGIVLSIETTSDGTPFVRSEWNGQIRESLPYTLQPAT